MSSPLSLPVKGAEGVSHVSRVHGHRVRECPPGTACQETPSSEQRPRCPPQAAPADPQANSPWA